MTTSQPEPEETPPGAPGEPEADGTAPDAHGDHREPESPPEPPTGERAEKPAGDTPEGRAARFQREAARRRREFQAVEQEAEQKVTAANERAEAAEALVDRLRWAEVDRQAKTDHHVEPAALRASGVVLADLCAEDGDVDPVKVAEAAMKARETLGLREPPRTGLNYQELFSQPVTTEPEPGFLDALDPRK